MLSLTVNYKGFVTKQLSQKLFVTFFSSTSLMQLLRSLLPMKVMQHLLTFNPAGKQEEIFKVLQDSMIFKNHADVLRKKHMVHRITSLYRHRRIRLSALINRVSKSQSLIAKLIKLQAAVRGHLARVKNAQAVRRIKTEARKKTKGYQMATKVQAAFRGYMFRIKRKRALAKLQKTVKEEAVVDPLGDEDFDAEAFLDVKKENLEQADIFANKGLVQKYI